MKDGLYMKAFVIEADNHHDIHYKSIKNRVVGDYRIWQDCYTRNKLFSSFHLAGHLCFDNSCFEPQISREWDI